MKTYEQIISNPRIAVIKKSKDGFRGIVSMPGYQASLIVSNGAGWEHASISPDKSRITPSWDDMCHLKEMLWNDDEEVIQIHPPKDMYVNNLPNCLHLWRCTYKEMVLPPSCLVGIRKGQTMAQMNKEIREAYEMAGEKYDI